MDDVSRVRSTPTVDDISESGDGDSGAGRRECWAWLCVHACSHAGLAVLVVAYTLLGAVLFELVEGGAASSSSTSTTSQSQHPVSASAERRTLAVQRSREECLRELWTITERLNVLYERNWTRLVHEQLRKFENNVMAATHISGHVDFPENEQRQQQQWSFGGALLYSVTVITTIGYGNLSPRTSLGKVLTMVYATFGVPLMLLCLSSLGQLLARAVHYVYIRLTCRANKEGNTEKIEECRSERRYKYQRAPNSPGRSICSNSHDSAIIQLSSPHKCLPHHSGLHSPHHSQQLHTPRKTALATVNSSHTRARCRLLSTHAPAPPPPPPPQPPDSEDPDETDDTESGNFSHDTPSRIPLIWREDAKGIATTSQHSNQQVSVPLTIVLIFLIAYLCLGAFIFASWENWSYLDATYFCFITLSTIGFGDLIPGKTFPSAEDYGHIQLIVCCVYLILGLILVAMSFSLIHEEVVNKCKNVARALGLHIH